MQEECLKLLFPLCAAYFTTTLAFSFRHTPGNISPEVDHPVDIGQFIKSCTGSEAERSS
jgi:hypothetical protein